MKNMIDVSHVMFQKEVGCGCNRKFLLYLFIRSAHVSYRRFIAIRYKFKLSTCVQEPLVIGRRGCVQREIEMGKRLAADNGHKSFSETGVV